MFKTNVGGADRVIRILLGIVLLGAFFALPDLGYRWILGLVGAIALITGALSSCPAYTLLGLSTCPMKKS